MNLGNRHSQHSFAQTPSANVQRSKFDRSFSAKDTFDFDYLTPFFLEEILPGDTINLNVKTFMRLAPQVKPIMDNMFIDFYFFFVPNRLTWNNWERFNGAQDDPGDSTDYLIPTITYPAAGFTVGTIFDKFGLPTGVAHVSGTEDINALPFRAYNLIYNEWFRDQNLINSLSVIKTDGPDAYTTYEMKKGAKKHDYFTSALPWPQKGDAVTMPLGTSAPVQFNGGVVNVTNGANNYTLTLQNTSTTIDLSAVVGGGSANLQWGTIANPALTGLEADLTAATSASINLFRQAMMMQSFLELDARGGTRYTEILRSHFNVVSPDFRLQRPEHLSSSTITINQHPVAQTSQSETDNPLGNLAAFSTAQETGNRVGFAKSFVEHGYVIGLVKARGEVTYQQGLAKIWNRRTREDFFWPKFQELGEQAILKKEIFFAATTADEDVFGYIPRHDEYRFRPSEIRGQFRSTFATSLDVWHLAEEFGAAPSLNQTFIESNTPIERALVVPDPAYPHMLADYWFDFKHVRPMVAYPVPATLGRF